MNVFLWVWVAVCGSPVESAGRIEGWLGALDSIGTHACLAVGKRLTPLIKEGMTREQVERILGGPKCVGGGLLWPEVYERWGIVVKYDVKIDDSAPDPTQWKSRWHVRRAYHTSDSECPIRVYRTPGKGNGSEP